MIKEIGSEFWEVEIGENKKLPLNVPYEYLLSGRTALDFIIKDIKFYKDIKSVYMPSYCCHTMIQPFLDNNIDVEFYNVSFEGGKYRYDLDYDNKSDLILIMKYFGFHNEEVDLAIKKYKQSGKMIIEDATHSWLSDIPYNKNSDYVFASFRKWTGLAGGAIALNQTRDFVISVPNKENFKYIELRKESALLKKRFIENGIGQKQVFLDMFNEAEELLEVDYQGYGISKTIQYTIKFIDSEKIIKTRRENAKILIDGLKDVKEIESIDICVGDVPLFVHIIVLNGKRDQLRQYLTKNKVYFPVHWPLSSAHNIESRNMYNDCLSLVCDQRYTNTDMDRIINLINEFYRKEV